MKADHEDVPMARDSYFSVPPSTSTDTKPISLLVAAYIKSTQDTVTAAQRDELDCIRANLSVPDEDRHDEAWLDARIETLLGLERAIGITRTRTLKQTYGDRHPVNLIKHLESGIETVLREKLREQSKSELMSRATSLLDTDQSGMTARSHDDKVKDFLNYLDSQIWRRDAPMQTAARIVRDMGRTALSVKNFELSHQRGEKEILELARELHGTLTDW